MGALNPLFLLAGAAISIPIWLHLFQKHETRRIIFPALRYLERTEREHARTIRLRQLLLMLTRIVILILLVAAGARLYFGGRGTAHPATAAVIVLDNSLSSGLVVGDVRVLDRLKELAAAALDEATSEDRFWLVRAGEPWIPAIPGTATEVRASVEETEPSDAGGDLSGALERAARLLETSGMEHREIHLLSDLQATGFTTGSRPGPAGAFDVVAWTGQRAQGTNRALTSVMVGAGLPPLEGQRADVTVSALETTSEEDTVRVPARLIVNERIRGAATLAPGSETTIALPPSGTGWIEGYVDADPDALRADDRRFFAFRSRPAPQVARAGDVSVFVAEALGVLENAGRVRPAAAGDADALVSGNGEGLDRRSSRTASLIVPSDDPALLPALNRRLAEAGIPWVYEPSATAGERELEGVALPESLSGVRVRARYELTLAGDPPAPSRTLAEVGGRPWAVEGSDGAGRRYLLIGSPMDASGTTLPVSTGMLRFIDWVAGAWAGAGGAQAEVTTGSHLPAPAAATSVRFPDGTESEIDATRVVRGTGVAGLYTFLAADSVVAIVALNPPPEESRLEPLAEENFPDAIGRSVTEVDRAGSWPRAVFRSRQGPELWWPFLLAGLALLILESLMATSGERNPLAFRREAESTQADGVD